MGIIGTLIIGLIVGAVAKLIMPGKQGGGIILTMLLGVIGSFVAKYLGQAIGLYGPNQGAGFIASVVGALIVMFVYGLLTKSKTEE